MDAFARGLRNAARMQHEAVLSKAKSERYKSFKSGIGAKIEQGTTSLEELEVGVGKHTTKNIGTRLMVLSCSVDCVHFAFVLDLVSKCCHKPTNNFGFYKAQLCFDDAKFLNCYSDISILLISIV